ncbi:ABC-three component system protein [Endozoicomonas sp. ONNA1]|uniref:HNH endonuclease n=1 Tax=Endozoicomonas sp. ONNA1 TaxID=2828740 RepID=UPI002149893F|nr:ABC-three component system protein [Endozoicomonas sp. ONNA1]
MANKRKSFSENTNIALFNQVNGICPLCDTPLLYEKNGSKYKKYELAHIYPLNPKPEETIVLKGVEQLSTNVDDDDNLIPLCKICHGKFDKPRTRDEYNNLVAIKKGLIAKTKQHEIWHQYQIEQDINKIISSLYDENINLDVEEIEYDPKQVDRKADKSLTNLFQRCFQTDHKS